MPKARKIHFVLSSLLLVFLFSPTAFAATISLEAEEDSVISSYSNPESGGDGGNLHVSYRIQSKETQHAMTLIKFDLSPIPSNASIDSAELRLFTTLHETDGSTDRVYVDRNIQDWSENGVWADRPSSISLNESEEISQALTWNEWDVTDAVESWVEDGEDNYGLKLRGSSGGFEVKFSSRERNSNRPKLVIDYSVPIPLIILDTTGPVISDVTTSDITATSARVTWVTNEPATSRLEYGDFSTTESNVWGSDLVTSHDMTLSDLTPDISYIYAVLGTDGAGNLTVNSVFTFNTEPAPLEEDTLPPDDGVSPSPLPADGEVEDNDLIFPFSEASLSQDEDEESEAPPRLFSETTITYGDVIESVEKVTGGSGEYYVLGILLLVLLTLVTLIVVKKKTSKEADGEQKKEEIEKPVKTGESQKGNIGVLVLLSIVVFAAILVVSYKIYSQPKEPVDYSLEGYHDPSGNTDAPKPNDLTQGVICESTVLKVDLQIFEKGWECSGQDMPEASAGSIIVTSDIFNINISNMGRGGFCGMGEDAVCFVEDYPLTRNIVDSKKYTDGVSGEIFARFGSSEGPWISITYEGIGKRELTDEEQASLFRFLESVQVY